MSDKREVNISAMKQLGGESGWDVAVGDARKGLLELVGAMTVVQYAQLAPKPEDIKSRMDSRFLSRLAATRERGVSLAEPPAEGRPGPREGSEASAAG